MLKAGDKLFYGAKEYELTKRRAINGNYVVQLSNETVIGRVVRLHKDYSVGVIWNDPVFGDSEIVIDYGDYLVLEGANRNARVVARRITDPVTGATVIEINGTRYREHPDHETKPGDYIVFPTGALMRVENVETTVDNGVKVKTYGVKTMDGEFMEVSEGKFTPLRRHFRNPCPWCDESELHPEDIWKDGEFGTKILVQKLSNCPVCHSAVVSDPNDRNKLSCLNPDGHVYDPKTREILVNPDFIDDEPAGYLEPPMTVRHIGD